jgi:hypothetical protein
MAQPIPIVAQYVMDSYYQDFKQESEFFDLPDFIFHSASTVGDYYRQEYKQMYDQIRAEKSDEIVAFSEDLLVPITLKVKDNVATFPKDFSVMSFTSDRQTSGFQKIFVTKPKQNGFGIQLERSNLYQIWQLRYVTKSNVVYWYYDRGAIKFFTKGEFNIQEIDVLYVPGVSTSMLVPDSLIDWTVNNTVQKMKAIKQGTVVKQSIDNNNNPIQETEMNKNALK